MGKMFHKTRDLMNNWRWNNPRAFSDQDDHFNVQTNSSRMVKHTDECCSWYSCNHLRAKIEPPSCRQYKPGYFLAVRPLNRDEINKNDDDEENWADSGLRSGGGSHPRYGNDNDDREVEEETQHGEKGTMRRKGTKDGKAKGKGRATENGKGQG